MKRRTIYIISGLVVLTLLTWLQFSTSKANEDSTAVIKVALRDVGHQLLLSNQDSTSLVLPIKKIAENTFELSFEKALPLKPGSLVTLTQESIAKSSLSEHYIVEVIQCSDREVAYSYEMKQEKENEIIPCSSRTLPASCYTIQIHFLDKKESIFGLKSLLITLLIGLFVLLLLDIFKKEKALPKEPINDEKVVLGNFHFYPEQNKLVKEAQEISLSKKECELLAIFVASPNQIIKRDELTKKVWEDNGVFVGRSLDTYISKLRKKLQDDSSIKLSNVHGVGYKLEIEE